MDYKYILSQVANHVTGLGAEIVQSKLGKKLKTGDVDVPSGYAGFTAVVGWGLEFSYELSRSKGSNIECYRRWPTKKRFDEMQASWSDELEAAPRIIAASPRLKDDRQKVDRQVKILHRWVPIYAFNNGDYICESRDDGKIWFHVSSWLDGQGDTGVCLADSFEHFFREWAQVGFTEPGPFSWFGNFMDNRRVDWLSPAFPIRLTLHP